MSYNVISATDINDALWAASKLAKLAWDGMAYVYEFADHFAVSRYEMEVTGARLVAEVCEKPAIREYDLTVPYAEVREYLRNRDAEYVAQAVEWR